METLTALLSINWTVMVVFDYRVSFIETVGIISAVASVYYAATLNRLTWSSGLISTAAFFWVFYQVQLYSDMFLQVFFAVVTLYGWYQWREVSLANEPVRSLSTRSAYLSLAIVAIGSLALGSFMSHIHILAPTLFPHPAASPFQDGFTAAASVVATMLLARRMIESWILWIGVDLVSIPLYLTRAIPFMALLYVVFLGMAANGLVIWLKRRNDETRIGVR